MKRKKTGFESFAQKFLIVTAVIFVFGIITVKSMESSYNRDCQKIEKEIEVLKTDIDSLAMQKQELVSFDRLVDIATSKGYSYQSDSTAAYTSGSSVVNE